MPIDTDKFVPVNEPSDPLVTKDWPSENIDEYEPEESTKDSGCNKVILTYRAKFSFFSAFSVLCLFSLFSFISFFSFFSMNSIVSVCSANSVLSLFSANCLMCIGCVNSSFCVIGW